MPIMLWNQNLDVGVNEMNLEHQEILRLMNNLYDLFGAKGPKDQQEKILMDLANYTVKHFEDEEKYMASINFSGLEVHKLIHQQLLSQFMVHVEKFKKPDGVLTEEFFNFLRVWLTAHIQGIDIKYGKATSVA